MKKTWYELYTDEIKDKGSIVKYVDNKIKRKNNLIKLIKKYSPNKKIIEAGSGTGVLSTYLASIGFNATAIDIDDDILKLSRKIAEEYKSENKPEFKKESIFEMNYNKNEFDVSFSNGVLEHFSDEEIIQTLKKQLVIAKTVIVGIPTCYFDYSEAMYGDERYLKISYWRTLIKKAGGRILEETSCHYLSRWKIICNVKKYFRPYPYRIFVIQLSDK